MKYILTEEDIKELVYDTSYYRDINVNTLSEEEIIEDFLKNKSPITELASGKVDNINCYECDEGFLVGGKSTSQIFEKYQGKNIKIYVEEIK